MKAYSKLISIFAFMLTLLILPCFFPEPAFAASKPGDKIETTIQSPKDDIKGSFDPKARETDWQRR